MRRSFILESRFKYYSYFTKLWACMVKKYPHHLFATKKDTAEVRVHISVGTTVNILNTAADHALVHMSLSL